MSEQKPLPGFKPPPEPEMCWRCKGTGYMPMPIREALGQTVTCTWCEGTGHLVPIDPDTEEIPY